jgi:hypothetical protein
MWALRSQKSSSVSTNAVSETVKRVNAQALALLNRRAEINRRIHCLHRVVQGLRDLATSPVCDAGEAAPGRAMDPSNREPKGRHEAGDNRSPFEHRDAARSQFAVHAKQMLPALSRACRIALMEAGEAASSDEIRSRIDRRGSFTFSDSGIAEAAIVRTLTIMRDNGEIRDVRSGDHALWQRVHPSKEREG